MTNTLITGANKGLGYETARRLIADGHQVYLGARDPERGKRAAAELDAHFVELDVADDASVAAAAAELAGRIGHRGGRPNRHLHPSARHRRLVSRRRLPPRHSSY
jgi:NAD(P)-dependent dehydrogenase (short-subunit alcohol dehydrogenase family)